MHKSAFDNLTTQYQLTSKIRVAKRSLFAKTPTQSRNFNELDIFRKQIDHHHEHAAHQPYTAKKKSVRTYRMIFFTLAFLFTVLGITTMSVPSALSLGFFSLPTTLKGLVITLCTTMALASFLVCISLRTDREAVIHAMESARRTLHTLYMRKKVQLGMKRFFTIFGHQRRHANALHHMYHDIREKMNDKKEETLQLISRINLIPSIDKERKELLLNQAIAELHDTLMRMAHSFRHADPTLG